MVGDGPKISRSEHCGALELGKVCLDQIPGRWLLTHPPLAPQLKGLTGRAS